MPGQKNLPTYLPTYLSIYLPTYIIIANYRAPVNARPEEYTTY